MSAETDVKRAYAEQEKHRAYVHPEHRLWACTEGDWEDEVGSGAGLERFQRHVIAVILQAGNAADLRANLLAIRAVVDRQAEDEGLWSLPLSGSQPIMEAYLQQELRHLHKVVEDYTKGLS